MPERTPEQIRAEIAAERQELAGDLDMLRSDVRSLVPVVLAGAIALVGVKLLWKLR